MYKWTSKYDFFLSLMLYLCEQIKKILADRGYCGEFIELIRNTLGINIEVTLSSTSKGKFIPAKDRWIAEKSIAWIDNFRRLLRNELHSKSWISNFWSAVQNHENSFETARQIVIIIGIAMLLKHIPHINIHY